MNKNGSARIREIGMDKFKGHDVNVMDINL
ncbi:Uncharacterised protein [Legionella pneumophila]|nr:hypothetical protein ULM_22090 [Legionella pneumophila]CZG25302.1 Uncharacterised protein [Legionella pneumophila]CZG62358.1 Uncharacterised protein [Legionella pneumophila]CZH04599.1 Uncharacterised protein [Legionella pneumophila]CZH12932.1 Uncharacterised protein [Legionella pneumophila]